MGLKHKEPYYITTPIYYINDEPHIGHFYCTTTADVLARYHRLIGDEVYFVTGTDENSQKTIQAAELNNSDIQKFTDMMAQRWEKAWQDLKIDYDFFIRTTMPEHKKSVEKILQHCYDQGDIYKKEYEGLYCVGCEKFLTDSDMDDGKCAVHKTKPDMVKEENYFFKLSKYEDYLLELFSNDDFALPVPRRNEMIEFIKQGLQDISISREAKGWGIPLPIDNTQVVYVWFDALINYITALGYYKDDDKMNTFWPYAIHLVGKDIFRFHTIMWPAMLKSAGLNPPKQVFGHGFFTINGEKISKSLGNVVNPVQLAKKYGIDAIKYFILKEIPFGKDSDFSVKRLEERYTGDLSHDLGNLLNRSLNMVEKYCDCMIPPSHDNIHNEKVHKSIQDEGEGLLNIIDKHYTQFEFSQLLDKVWHYISTLNKYIDETKPWVLNKEGKTDVIDTVLFNLLQGLSLIAYYIYPVMPDTGISILKQIGIEIDAKELNYIEGTKWNSIKSGIKVQKGDILFPPLEELGDNEMEEKKENLIDIEDFLKLDLRIAEILSAERVEGTDKLVKLSIKIGDEERVLLAGIAQFYSEDELKGKKVVVIKNLKPRKMRGIESQGMLLAASNDNGDLTVLTVDKEIESGAKVS